MQLREYTYLNLGSTTRICLVWLSVPWLLLSFPTGSILAVARSDSVGGNGGGTLQKNGHIVDYVQTLKRSQDEIFRKIDWLTKTVEEKDHEDYKFRLKFSRKVHTLENKVLLLEHTFTQKVEEIVQSKVDEINTRLRRSYHDSVTLAPARPIANSRDDGKRNVISGNGRISNIQSHQPAPYSIRYQPHQTYYPQYLQPPYHQTTNSWGFYQHPITHKRVRDPSVYGFEPPTRDLPRLSLVATASSIPEPRAQLNLAPHLTTGDSELEGSVAERNVTDARLKEYQKKIDVAILALKENVTNLEREIMRIIRTQNRENDNSEFHRLLVENSKEITALHQKDLEMIHRIEHFAVEVEKAAAKREHAVNESLKDLSEEMKRQVTSMKAYTKRHMQNVTAPASNSQPPDKLKCAQTLLDELVAQLSKPKNEQSPMYQMDLISDQAGGDADELLLSYAASRDPSVLSTERLSKELKLQRKEIIELKSEIGKLNISQILVMRTVDEETLKRTVRPRDCSEIRLLRKVSSGIYSIFPYKNDVSTEVFCDMETNGGGWTLIQRRGTPIDRESGLLRESFIRGWEDYARGFGSLSGDFWIGLSNISALCNLGVQELRIDLTNWSGETRYANYQYFKVSNASDQFRIHLSGYSGTAGDSLARHNGMAFSTPDRDNDGDPRRHCAKTYLSGWWYYACFESNLNGLYIDDDKSASNVFGTGIIWQHWTSNVRSLKQVEMKIRNTFIIGDNQYLRNMFSTH